MLLATLIASNLLSATPFSIRANGATITVPNDYEKIQWAIGNATEGDTIYVRNGTRKEAITINKQLTIQGEDRETTLIDAMGEGNGVYMSADQVEFFGARLNAHSGGALTYTFFDVRARNARAHGIRSILKRSMDRWKKATFSLTACPVVSAP